MLEDRILSFFLEGNAALGQFSRKGFPLLGREELRLVRLAPVQNVHILLVLVIFDQQILFQVIVSFLRVDHSSLIDVSQIKYDGRCVPRLSSVQRFEY